MTRLRAMDCVFGVTATLHPDRSARFGSEVA
jgi:hypothetical protein